MESHELVNELKSFDRARPISSAMTIVRSARDMIFLGCFFARQDWSVLSDLEVF